MRNSLSFISYSTDIPREQIIDLTPVSRDLTNHLRETSKFPNEQRYAKFVKGPIYLSYETEAPYSDHSALSMPTVAAYLNEMKRNTNSNPIGGSLSRITRRDNKMSTSTGGQQVTKYCQILRKVYSK